LKIYGGLLARRVYADGKQFSLKEERKLKKAITQQWSKIRQFEVGHQI
jgi:hypothetical protein